MREFTPHLLSLMQAMLREHETLMNLMDHKMEAMRLAKNDEVSAYTVLENEGLGRLLEMEKERQALVADITQQLSPRATDLLTLQQIAKRLPREESEQLLDARKALIESTQKLQQKTKILQRATEGVLNNVRGILNSIGQAMAGGGATYSQRGRLNTGSGVLSGTFNATA